MKSIIALSLFTLINGLNVPIIRKATAPLNDIDIFDPSVVSKNIQLSFIRESELKHGRLAMVVATAFPVMEQFSDVLGINQFQHLPVPVQLGFTGAMFVSEFTSMLKGWENPSVKVFRLKEDYQPGDLGFGVWSPDDPNIGTLMDKELNNGRLAMIGIVGMMAQELVTHQQLF
jgi:light-harvesting complex I chlorophyll a/b binding protein 1